MDNDPNIQKVSNKYAKNHYEEVIIIDKRRCMWWDETVDRMEEYQYGYQRYNVSESEDRKTRLWYSVPFNAWILEYKRHDRIAKKWESFRWEVISSDDAEDWFGECYPADCNLIKDRYSE